MNHVKTEGKEEDEKEEEDEDVVRYSVKIIMARHFSLIYRRWYHRTYVHLFICILKKVLIPTT